jgi:type I restriction enzyme S subunit
LDTNSCDTISKDRISDFEDIIINNGDILMALTGGTIGKVVRVENINEIVLQNYRVGNFFPKNDNALRKGFLYWVLKSNLIYEQIMFMQRETGQPNVGKEDFRQIFMSLPPINEQDEIANFLEQTNSEINVIIERHNRSIELLKEYRTSLISDVVTGKIDVREEVVHEP